MSVKFKLLAGFLAVTLFASGLWLLNDVSTALTFMPNIFYGLMVISAFLAVYSVAALIVNWLINDENEDTEARLLNQFIPACILFCLAAIGAKLWGAFPV
jgi:hypothetical protein